MLVPAITLLRPLVLGGKANAKSVFVYQYWRDDERVSVG
jgi:hypothetical protein